MAYEAGMGMPVIASGGGDFLGGGGGIGSLLIGALLFGGGGFGGFGGRGVAGADLAATQGIQNQLNGLTSQLSTQGISNELGQLSTNAAQNAIATNAAIDANGRGTASALGDISTSLAASNYTNLVNTNSLGRDISAAINQGALQQLNSFNNLTTTTLQGFNEIGRDTANAFNQIIMGQNGLSAQLASCCCETKAAIHADGEMTRALINANTMADLQNRLNIANQSIQTQTIINSLKPVVIA